MSRRRAAVFCMLAAAALVGACAPPDGEPPPPEIAYGFDICAECNMIISDARFAAASLTSDGVMSKFDDIGDMVRFHAAHPELSVRAWFVHDYHAEEWLRGEQAFFVVSSAVHSPMGHGVVAFKDRTAADALARELSVSILTLEQLRAEVAAQTIP